MHYMEDLKALRGFFKTYKVDYRIIDFNELNTKYTRFMRIHKEFNAVFNITEDVSFMVAPKEIENLMKEIETTRNFGVILSSYMDILDMVMDLVERFYMTKNIAPETFHELRQFTIGTIREDFTGHLMTLSRELAPFKTLMIYLEERKAITLT
jgi:hypothetical protein